MEKQLKALYEIHRQQILLNAKNKDGNSNFPEAYVHAASSRIAPIFHHWHGDGNDPFDTCYRADVEFTEAVANYLDDCWLAKQIPTFYDLEGKFGHEHRSELLDIVRYCALDDRFDQAFYTALLKNGECPIEALNAARPFDEMDASIL